jgi:hypothetical protein
MAMAQLLVYTADASAAAAAASLGWFFVLFLLGFQTTPHILVELVERHACELVLAQ